jgi:hypothetical protein
MAEPPKLDLRAMSKRLREQTCSVLKLDPDKLSAADEIVVSRAGALRLLISDMEAAQLRGLAIDVAKYVEASEQLERIVRHHDPTPNGDGSESNKYAQAQAQFEALLNAQLAACEREETREAPRLREKNARLLDENFKLKAQLKELSSAKPVPTRPDKVVPMSGVERANSTKPPAHYLKQYEPWEEFYNNRR